MKFLKLVFLGFIVSALTMCDTDDTDNLNLRGNVEGQIRKEGVALHDNGGILIELLYTSYSTLTSTNGAYTISDVPIGQYTIRASYPNYISGETHDVSIEANATTGAQNFVLEPVKGIITGQITLEQETDYTGIMVNINNTGCVSVTDKDGNFTIKDVPIGQFTFIASMPGYVSYQTNLIIEPGDNINLGPIELLLE